MKNPRGYPGFSATLACLVLRRLALAVLAAAFFVPTGSANAAVPLAHCGQTVGLECGRVDVPLDRSGRVPGTLLLYVEYLPTKETPFAARCS